MATEPPAEISHQRPVRLTGEVTYQAQSTAGYDDEANMFGVIVITQDACINL